MVTYEDIVILIDRDPSEAVSLARKHLHGDINIDQQRAGVLVDAGAATRNSEAVREGIDVFRSLLASYPDELSFKYNIGNGLHELARLASFDDGWHQATSELRRESRIMFSETTATINNELKSTSHTNLGNLLLSSHRWVEAFDSYIDAVKAAPSNGIALTGVLRALHYGITEAKLGDPEATLGVAAHYANLAASLEQDTVRFGGERGWKAVQPLIDMFQGDELGKEDTPLSPYERFVIQERLALSPTLEGTNIAMKRWDSLTIGRVAESIDAEQGVPPLFSMMNVIKADYLAARWFAFKSIYECDDIPETGTYADTLDYAVYGARVSAMCTAQRCALDVLDKIAVSVLDYLGVPGAKRAHFKSFWHKKNDAEWKSQIQEEWYDGNKALLALVELAEDLNKSGFLHSKSMLRNASTHRFTVLHDMDLVESRENKCVEHYLMSDFERNLLETIRLAKAACIYFVELIARKEARDKNDAALPIFIEDHHRIRGEA